MTTGDVPSSAPAAEDKAQPMYLDLGEWVSDHFIPVFRRTLGGQYRWCAEWWRHDEAVSRLKALWHAWEVLRLEPGTGIGTWYREHLDHQLPILMGARGPFYQCSETVHREPHEAAAQVLPKGRQDPTVAGEYGAMPGRESAALGQHMGVPDGRG